VRTVDLWIQDPRDTSSGARAMRGFGAMCLLRRSRCMFLAPQCAALRCPWMSSPCSARGACPFLCPWSAWCFVYCTSAHVQQNCTVVQYKKKGRTPTNERTTNEIPFNRKDYYNWERNGKTLVYGGPNHHTRVWRSQPPPF